MRSIISSPRVLRTGQPLSLEAVRQVCPAVFAEGPHSSRGERYRYVPTIVPLEKLLANGWGIYECSGQRAREITRGGYTKHMLRLRKLENFSPNQVVRDGVPEVILINAHDGTSAYHLRGGYFRFVCSNGMIVGTTMAGFTVRHTVGPQTAEEVLEAGERVVTETFPKMLENIELWRSTVIPYETQVRLAQRAVDLRYGSTLSKFPPEDLLHARRDEDKEGTLWQVLNRVQENIMDGGWETRSIGWGRRSQVRPVERVSAVVAINQGLWNEATKIAEEMA